MSIAGPVLEIGSVLKTGETRNRIHPPLGPGSQGVCTGPDFKKETEKEKSDRKHFPLFLSYDKYSFQTVKKKAIIFPVILTRGNFLMANQTADTHSQTPLSHRARGR